MHRTATLVVAATVAALSLALAGCTGAGGTGGAAPTAASGESITLAGSFPNAGLADPFWISMQCGAEAEAKQLGATITFKNAQDASASNVAQAINAAALSSPQGLLVSGSGDSANNAEISKLEAAGVPVVATNVANSPAVEYASITDSTDFTNFVDYVTKDVGTSGSVGVLGGVAGYPILEIRWKPLVAALASSAPGIKVIDTQYDDFDRSKASSAASALIVSHPDLKAIYAVSGPEGEGAAAAVAQAGKVGQIKVYTFGSTPEVVQDITAGSIQAAFAQGAYLQGVEGVKALVAYIKSGQTGAVKPDPSKTVAVPLKVLTKDNLNSPDATPYKTATSCN